MWASVHSTKSTCQESEQHSSCFRRNFIHSNLGSNSTAETRQLGNSAAQEQRKPTQTLDWMRVSLASLINRIKSQRDSHFFRSKQLFSLTLVILSTLSTLAIRRRTNVFCCAFGWWRVLAPCHLAVAFWACSQSFCVL